MSAVDWESMRLHPYHAERILANVPAFAHVTPLVAAHHERPDGQGYPRGLRGEQLPLGARLLAVADAFDELPHTCPEGAARDPGDAPRGRRAVCRRRAPGAGPDPGSTTNAASREPAEATV